ncbi:hypothetical protein [Paenibacillus alginolyticus]|uniref:Uncharacterized protein n=1 Tax=Paenibacillus alginolyticus TaxID=59839 RepID=A0ABT4GLI2_9BACL|nr:hypothetical protein [Paenibacillus alginolyticus]MCY9697063.1 hypothetical protein [Paenibacillus alginolyticus]MEC0147457.1 hypothetical protein [Paenibacillus alginolyticus]
MKHDLYYAYLVVRIAQIEFKSKKGTIPAIIWLNEAPLSYLFRGNPRRFPQFIREPIDILSLLRVIRRRPSGLHPRINYTACRYV